MLQPTASARRLPSWPAAVARPLEAVYASAAAWRRRASRRPGYQRRLRRPVVSVGNLVVGGAGKTPLVAHLATLLREAGEYPAVLSRGYGRTAWCEGAVVVRDAHAIRADLARAGDEPLMLAERLPGCAVVVSDDRHLAGVLAESRLGCTIHVLDDGFQHLSLARDLDLLLVRAADLTGERVLPGGRLRESPPAAAAADGWLVDPEEFVAVEALARAAGVSHLSSVVRTLGAPIAVAGDAPFRASGGGVLLVSGVAHSSRFEEDVRAAGWRVVDHLAFADHHRYDEGDVRRFIARAQELGAVAVLTTEKDAVKLRAFGPFALPVAALPLAVRVEPDGVFREWLRGRLARAVNTPGAR
jgi:tetraacyldisaccharide 4'-kinase